MAFSTSVARLRVMKPWLLLVAMTALRKAI